MTMFLMVSMRATRSGSSESTEPEKTTFLKMIAGLEEPDNGQIIRQNGLRITYLPQNPEFPEGANVLDYVADGKWEQDWNTESEAKTVLTRLGITEYMAKIESCPADRKNGSRWQGLW